VKGFSTITGLPASSIALLVALADGMQLQWPLDPENTDMLANFDGFCAFIPDNANHGEHARPVRKLDRLRLCAVRCLAPKTRFASKFGAGQYSKWHSPLPVRFNGTDQSRTGLPVGVKQADQPGELNFGDTPTS
jgi:hypothetical protein